MKLEDAVIILKGCIRTSIEATASKEMLYAIVDDLAKLKTPDFETGLMDCGCGGKAAVGMTEYDGENWMVSCKECGTTAFETYPDLGGEPNAKDNWNKAMGYKGGSV